MLSFSWNISIYRLCIAEITVVIKRIVLAPLNEKLFIKRPFTLDKEQNMNILAAK